MLNLNSSFIILSLLYFVDKSKTNENDNLFDFSKNNKQNNKNIDVQSFSAMINEEEYSKLEIKTITAYNYSYLPKNFDARTKWPNCSSIRRSYEEGSCNWSWAMAAASVASDRTCIHASLDVQLSEQDLQCCKECYKNPICFETGDHLAALRHWEKNGLVTNECKPYSSFELKTLKCEYVCKDNETDYEKDKIYGSSLYKIDANVNTIKAELVKQGPVLAAFRVYTDFLKYYYKHENDVYSRNNDAEFVGHHVVKVIGYGVSGGKAYWLIANSFGEYWGYYGFAKIEQNDPKLEFENHMVTALPKQENF